MADIPERPSFESIEERDSNFNRIRIPPELREQVMRELAFNDSSESIPVPSDYDYEYPDPSASNPDLNKKPASSPAATAAGTKTADLAAPATKSTKPAKAPSNLSAVVQSSDIPTPKVEPQQDPLAKEGEALKNMEGRKWNGQNGLTPTPSNTGSGTAGGTLSQVSTQEDTEGKKRPGTMRRLTSKIKRTISSKG